MIDARAFFSAMRGKYIFRRQSAVEIERQDRSLQRIEERILDGRKVSHEKKLETLRRRLRLEVSILLHDEGSGYLAVDENEAPKTFNLMTGGMLDGAV